MTIIVLCVMIDEACKGEWLDKISGKRGVQTDNMTEFFAHLLMGKF